MGCAEGIVKILVFATNLLFALGGLAILIVGVLYKINIHSYVDAIPDDYQNLSVAPILTIVVGCVIFVIAFFGCCGAIKENPCLLTTYAVILIIIFLVQIGIGVYAFLEIKDKDDLREKVDQTLNNIFGNYQKHAEIPDLIQSEFECCGLNGPTYWSTPPNTCYPDKDSNKSIYTAGCAKTFFDFLIDSMKSIGITLLTISAVEVTGCILSLCLSSSIKNRHRHSTY